MTMPFPDRRRAVRLGCNIPILLHTAGRSLRTTSVDLSRVGTLVRVPFSELGLERHIPLAELGRAATFLLGDIVRLDLHYEVLGTLVQRSARPVRLGRAHAGQDFLEVGLDLLEPISDMEAEFLGLPLPPLQTGQPATWIPAAQPVRTLSANGAPDVTVLLCPQDELGLPPLRVVPEHIDRAGLRAALGPLEKLPVLPASPGAAAVLAVLAETYGGEPRSVILVDAEPVWSGTSRFSAVEVSPRDHTVRMQLEFETHLPDRASRRLGFFS